MGKLAPIDVVKYPLLSEDAVTLLESENKITFIVNKSSDKHDIKRAIQELYEVRVQDVRTLITPEGEKKAFVKLTTDFKASDLAVRLGIL
ncbi:MAG TPA: 50S ribosomal protein L23 [Candidatus Acidoferrales bacterium]|nr:50S ribosomal protein L23 [Candidatus Acidoferrales bacterium]